MKLRWLSCPALLVLFAWPTLAVSGEKAAPPTAVFRVRSIDSILDNIKLVAELAGKKDFGQQLEGLIKSKVGNKGLEGVDTKRPFGGYAKIGDDLNDIAGILMIPIADEQAFLKLLENLNYKTTKKDGGLYIIEQDALPIDIGFRFAHKYAYVTGLNLDAIGADRLLSPAQVFPKSAKGLVSGAFRLDQIPKAARDLAKAKIEEEFSKEKDKALPNETPAQKKLRLQMLDVLTRQFAGLIDEGAEIGGSFDIDANAKEVVFETHLSGKDQSKLATNIAELNKVQSQFSGMVSKNSFLGGLIRVSLPADLRKTLDGVIEEGKTAALAKEANPEKRKQAEAILAALEPTLRSGEMDLGISFQMTGNTASMVLGLAVKDGDKLAGTIRKLLEELPKSEKDKIKLDVSEVNGVKIHRVEASLDPKSKTLFGEKASAYIAFSKDAVLVSLGEGGLAAIKGALELKPGPASLLQFETSVAQFVQRIGQEAQKDVASKVFSKEDDGRVRVSVEGGQSLRFTFRASLGVLQFAAAVAAPRDVRLLDQGN